LANRIPRLSTGTYIDLVEVAIVVNSHLNTGFAFDLSLKKGEEVVSEATWGEYLPNQAR